MDVARLDVIGMSLESAKAEATRKGFQCASAENRNLGKNTAECNKRSPELLCPQRRYVIFSANPHSGKVERVSARIVENYCLGAM